MRKEDFNPRSHYLRSMKMTLVAATHFEIAPTVAFLEAQSMDMTDNWEILITGIGSMLTAYALTRQILISKPSFIIQAGIAGSFSTDYRPGSIVMVEEERMGDLGVEEKGLFRDVFDMSFADPNEAPFQNGSLKNPHLSKWEKPGIPFVKAVTVNEITTSQHRITQLRNKFLCEIETMEGAAFHYVCLKENLPFLQLRSISNFVGERDKGSWQLRESIEQLNTSLQQLITDHSL